MPLKPTTFGVSFPEVIMIANVFTSQNIRFYDFSIKPTKQIVALKGTNKNGVMRQAGFLGDSYSSKTTPKQKCGV